MDNEKFAYDNSYYHDIISEIGNYELMQAGTRRTILTFNDRWPEGTVSDERLPCKLNKDSFTGFRLHTGNLQKNTDNFALLSFADREKFNCEDISVYVNSEKCIYKGNYNPRNPVPVNQVFAWRIPKTANKDGYQVIEVVANSDGYVIDWVEILCR